MSSVKNYYFFRCYQCGEWYYSSKIIKTKKCWKCHHSFQFQKSTKFSKKCSMEVAIAILKELKTKKQNEDLSKYINMGFNLTFRKIE
ncbi:MAG: hypothetical protein ACFFDK_01280 [Promethearchaeota archaeon]